MVFVLTFFVLLNFVDFRKEIKALYFVYFNQKIQRKGLKLLGKRTVVFRDVENLDMNGRELKRIVGGVLDSKRNSGKMFDCLFLPDRTSLFAKEEESQRLDFFFTLQRDGNINNFLSNWLIPKKMKKLRDYLRRVRELNEDKKELVNTERDVNSGYAFACFSSFEAITTVQACSTQLVY